MAEEEQQQNGNASQDKIILHGMGRFGGVPSVSPFVVKLESFLRLASLEYEFTTQEAQNKVTGKMPWIEWKGEQLYDSQLIMDKLLADGTAKTIDSQLDDRQKAISHALQRMIDEHTFWYLAVWRFVREKDGLIFKTFPNMGWLKRALAPVVMQRKVSSNAHGHGFGRLTAEEQDKAVRADLQALNDILGDNQFLMGKDKPSSVDCAAFGLLIQFLYVDVTSPVTKWLNDDFPNLVSYVQRVKEAIWPDWEECIGKAKEAAPTEEVKKQADENNPEQAAGDAGKTEEATEVAAES